MDLTQKIDRMVGSFRGLAVGDALGAPVEFKKPGTFPPVHDFRPTEHFNLEAGQWTDDTIMAICLGDALVAADGYDSWAVMDEYDAWYSLGKNTPFGRCFDIGNQTSTAIRRYTSLLPVVLDGEKRGTSAGNGAIMRLAPAAIVASHHRSTLENSDRLLAMSARETHYSEEAEQATVIFGRMLMACYGGYSKETILRATRGAKDRFSVVEMLKAVDENSKVTADGYIRASLEAAWWAFLTTENFEDCVLRAVNLGDDADTVGAIAGQLAGAFYGDSAINESWKRRLWQTKRIEELAMQLMTVSPLIRRTRFEEDAEFQRLR